MNNLLVFEKYLGDNFEFFNSLHKKKCLKKYHPNSDSYSVFIENNEFMFLDDEIHSIEINNFNSDFNFLEDTLTKLESSNLKWEIFQKYSCDKNLVIKFNNYIYFEYFFESEKFILSTIRISDKE